MEPKKAHQLIWHALGISYLIVVLICHAFLLIFRPGVFGQISLNDAVTRLLTDPVFHLEMLIITPLLAFPLLLIIFFITGFCLFMEDKMKVNLLKDLQLLGIDEHQFDSDGVDINYVSGPANGPALVLIPAQMGTWESYQKVLPELAKKFQVYALDLPGHGKSDWTTGKYSWQETGQHLKAFVRKVVKRPSIISGNSSGGLFALWLAAKDHQFVQAIILEDAPLFSAEMPRFKDHDRFVYNGLKHTVETIGNSQNRDLANYFKNTEVPTKDGKVRRIPKWFIKILSNIINRYDTGNARKPVDIP